MTSHILKIRRDLSSDIVYDSSDKYARIDAKAINQSHNPTRRALSRSDKTNDRSLLHHSHGGIFQLSTTGGEYWKAIGIWAPC
ncbi:hypothetical protein TNIN_33181 [Trichonephila inaurata madagascariensis]|uniref:Uncharacterized protein n=1 Tax=Trichonephila inaurata madagascariensis TaxID=2747483 RepID=A0A8X7BYX2_9ARAC|nr:hypothetical protein TNIN_33181 [Trichonephila inaurata madagascariensis]